MSFSDVTILKSWTLTRSRLLSPQRNSTYVVDVQYCSASPFYPWLYPQDDDVPSLIVLLDTANLHVFIVRLICCSSTIGYGSEIFDKIPSDDYDKRRQKWSYIMGARDPPARLSKPNPGPAPSQHPSMTSGVASAVFNILEADDSLKVCSDLSYLRKVMRSQFGVKIVNAEELPNVSSVGANSNFYVDWKSRYVSDQTIEDLRRRVRTMHQQWLNMDSKPATPLRRRKSESSLHSERRLSVSDREIQASDDASRSSVDRHHQRSREIEDEEDENTEAMESFQKNYHDDEQSKFFSASPKRKTSSDRCSSRQAMSRDGRSRRKASASRGGEENNRSRGGAHRSGPREKVEKYREFDMRTRAILEVDLLKSAINRFPSPTSNSRAHEKLLDLCEDLHYMVIDLQHDLGRMLSGQNEHAC